MGIQKTDPFYIRLVDAEEIDEETSKALEEQSSKGMKELEEGLDDYFRDSSLTPQKD